MKSKTLLLLIALVSVFAGSCSNGDACDARCRQASDEAELSYPLKRLIIEYANVSTSLDVNFSADCVAIVGNLVIVSSANFGYPQLVSGNAESTWTCDTITGGPFVLENIVNDSGGWDYHVVAPATFLVDGLPCEVDIDVVEIDDYPSDIRGRWCGTRVAPAPGNG